MSIITKALQDRCAGVCELCNNEPATIAYAVSPKSNDHIENEVALCQQCFNAVETTDNNHWQCLAGSVYNQEPSVQALSYRILHRHSSEEWASELLQSVEFSEEVVNWAMSAFAEQQVHKDAYGAVLENGDNVVLTQVLNVKGANFMAPKGTIVKRIRLVPDNTEQIEGKVNEQTIVILTKYVKKA